MKPARPSPAGYARRRRVRGDRTIRISLRGPLRVKLDRLAEHLGYEGKSARQHTIRHLLQLATDAADAADGANSQGPVGQRRS